ncbi:MAG TPA: ComEC/Rec2 family competence protein [Pilimelia sp.]|nr:ComEC/Rec2 family competence protein [Pilimelia sp.]
MSARIRLLPAARPRAGGPRAPAPSAAAPAAVAARELPDCRLAGLAGGVWAAALVGLHLGAAAAALGGAAAAAAGTALAVGTDRAQRRRSADWRARCGWVAVLALLGLCCGGLVTAARVAVRDAAPLRELAAVAAPGRAELVVRDDPRPVAAAAAGPPTQVVAADLIRFEAATGPAVSTSVRIVVLASHPGWRGLLPGQRVVASGRLGPARGGDLRAAVFSSAEPPALLGRPPWAQRAAGALRAGLQRACAPLPDEAGGLLPGLVVGDTSALDPVVAADFRATGLTHLLAVSGSNVMIVLGTVLLAARWSRAGPRLAAAACGVALVGFVVLARPSPSVVRAAAMGAVGLLALAAGRPRAAVPALCAAVTVLLLLDPELAGDPGFALSASATAGLLLLAPGWRDALRRRGVPPGAAEAVAVPAAAQLACAPLIAGLSGQVSLVALPANLLALPAVAPATTLGVAAAAVSPAWPAAAEFLAWLAGWPVRWLVRVARHGADVPVAAVPWPRGTAGGLLLVAACAAVLVAARRPGARRLLVVGAVALALGALPIRLAAPGWPPTGWILVACAVGQGDAVVLPAGPGAGVVVDAGPEPTAVDRCLRRLGITRVPLLAVSHLHADHLGGVAGVFRGRTVDAVVTTPWPGAAAPVAAARGQPAGAPGREVLARLVAGAPVAPVTAGWRYAAGELDLVAVGPAAELTGTRSDANNNSVVLRASVRGVTVLLAGDAEVEQQRELRERWGHQLRSDVLKLAHHGSAYQDPEFLDVIAPAAAVVSVGAGNRYGHPNPAVLHRLSRSGARVARTDVDGDVAVLRRPGGLAVARRGGRDLPGAARPAGGAAVRWAAPEAARGGRAGAAAPRRGGPERGAGVRHRSGRRRTDGPEGVTNGTPGAVHATMAR